MLKIRDLQVGKAFSATLVIKSAIARETKAKKPFLSLEFYDGTDTIGAAYWDWTSGNIPEVNSIVDVSGQVTEWMGAKQLNVKTMRLNNTLTLAEFTPTSDHDIAQIYKDAYALASAVDNYTLRHLTLLILEDLRDKWLTVPGAVSVHHNYIGGTLVHSYEVARYAQSIATITPEANMDLCIVGGLLHDVGKLYTYALNGVSIEMTYDGMLQEHSFIGASLVDDYHREFRNDLEINQIRLLQHIILSHHGKPEYGAAIYPQCIEAMIVHAADGLSASIEQVRQASTKQSNDKVWTERIYTLNNRAMLRPDFIDGVLQE